MRKWNAVLTAAIALLFLVHAVFGGALLLGTDTTVAKALAHPLLTLIAAHAVLGVKLTADTLRVWRKTGAAYFRENRLFWARRISGLAVMALLALHVGAFGRTENGVYRLIPFSGWRLAAELLLVLALAAHVVANVRPLLISFGVRRLKGAAGTILFVLSALLLGAAAAFIAYYLEWNVWNIW